MLKEQNNQIQTNHLHIFRLQENDNKLSVTHEQQRLFTQKICDSTVKNKRFPSNDISTL